MLIWPSNWSLGQPAEPWAEVLARVGEPPAFRDVAFQTFDQTKSLPRDQDLRRWFDVIAGQPQGIFETKTRLGNCAGIEGIVRLKSPWTEDSVLRIALDDYNRLQMHFFRGDAGVTLVYHEDDLQRWAAYQTTRQPRGVTPTSWAIAATDEFRNRRTTPKNHDQYELRCRAGEIVLSRGDVVLLAAPLGGLPDEVFFQGKAVFHGIALARTSAEPIVGPAVGHVVNVPEKERHVENVPHEITVLPNRVPWFQQLDERARVELLPDGGLRLAVPEKPKKRSWSATPIPRGWPAEMLLEIADVSPGAGIYLGNGKDGPRYVLRWVIDRRSKQVCLAMRHDDDVDEQDFRGLTEFPLPAVSPRHWLRLTFGAGQIRWSTSPDGVHWAEPAEPIRNMPPDVTHVGLHCVSRQSATGITLRRIVIRELPHLLAIVPAELRDKALAKADAPTMGAWLADVTEQTPTKTDSNAWRRACALKTLAAGCPRHIANDLLMLVVEDEFTRALPLDQQLAVLADAGRLLDVWDDHGLLQRFVKRYAELGLAARERDGSPPFSTIRHALMSAPFVTRHAVEVATEDALRAELLNSVYGGQWQAVRDLARQLRFFQLQAKLPLLEWADSLAQRRLPATAADTALAKQKEEWRELLIEDLNKDVYNALAQLRIELSGAGREDAARAIANIDRQLMAGVAPHAADGQLLWSLPAAVASALQRDPTLRDILAEKYRAVAELRLRQAIEAGDAVGVQFVAAHFSSSAAVEAHVWLGDRAMSVGDFADAAAEYRAATTFASAGAAARIAPKWQLAATLTGHDAGPALTGTIPFGETLLSADEFTRLRKELADRCAKELTRRTIDVGIAAHGLLVPTAVSYQVNRRAKIDGPLGNDPNREFARDTARRQLDWVDRQLGLVVEANWLFASNRFQISAFDMQSKQRVWQTPAPPGQMQFAQESTFSAARPLVTRDRLFARLLYGSGATLAAVDRANGQFMWTVAPMLNEEFVSDPWQLGGELACLKLVKTEQQESVLRLAFFDARTGLAARETDVLRLRESWRRRRCCEVAPLHDGLIVALGGVIARLDTAGRVRWVRKQTVLPADEEPQWVTQYFQPPFVAGERVFIQHPGARTIDCLRVDSGELVWSKLWLDLERLVGIADGRLIAQTARGFVAIELRDGTPRWSLDAEGVTVGATCDATQLLFMQRLPTDATRSRFRPRLVWVDATNGRITATSGLVDLEEADPRVGPLVIDQDRIWTFWGKGQNDPNRDVIELLPNGPAEPFLPAERPDAWARHVDPRLADATMRVLPTWKLLHGEFGDASGFLLDVREEKNVVGLRFRNSGPITLGRELVVPSNGQPKLRLRFGGEPGHAWRIEVRFRGAVVWSQDLNANMHPQYWKDFESDLSRLAGQEGWLTVRAFLPAGGDAPSQWKKLEIVL